MLKMLVDREVLTGTLHQGDLVLLNFLVTVNMVKAAPHECVFMFVCFVALRPKSAAMVMVGRSVHLTKLFPWQAWTGSYL